MCQGLFKPLFNPHSQLHEVSPIIVLILEPKKLRPKKLSSLLRVTQLVQRLPLNESVQHTGSVRVSLA